MDSELSDSSEDVSEDGVARDGGEGEELGGEGFEGDKGGEVIGEGEDVFQHSKADFVELVGRRREKIVFNITNKFAFPPWKSR